MNASKMILAWSMVFIYALLNSSGALIIKLKLNRLGEVHVSSFRSFLSYFVTLFTSYEVLCGLAFIFISALAWMVALSKMELSIAYPVGVGLNFLFILAMSILFVGEEMTFYKAIGIFFIFLGMIFMSKT